MNTWWQHVIIIISWWEMKIYSHGTSSGKHRMNFALLIRTWWHIYAMHEFVGGFNRNDRKQRLPLSSNTRSKLHANTCIVLTLFLNEIASVEFLWSSRCIICPCKCASGTHQGTVLGGGERLSKQKKSSKTRAQHTLPFTYVLKITASQGNMSRILEFTIINYLPFFLRSQRRLQQLKQNIWRVENNLQSQK